MLALCVQTLPDSLSEPVKYILLYNTSACDIRQRTWSNKSRLRNHPLPALLGGLLSRLHNLEHLLFCNTPHFRQWHTKFRSFLRSLVLDRTGQGLCIRRIRPIKQILGKWCAGGLIRGGGFDIPFFLYVC